MSAKPLIYLAAPLFNESERAFNNELVTVLEPYADIFLPQRDGLLLADMLASGLSVDIARQRVFQKDCDAMSRANALVAILDGAHIDEGVAFEIGYMHALEKPCVGFQSDVRRALPSGNNPMIEGSLCRVFSTQKDLSDWVQLFAKKRAA